MKGVGLASFVASLVFMICMQAFFKNIHALQNHSTPFFISSPSTRILKVGVPWKLAVDEFVSIEKNGTNFTVGGFCVKVFEEAIKTLNYSVQYIPLKLSTNKSEFDYMIHQIALKNLDAVVGDLTITSKRSQEVLFAQPFFDSGLVAVVPLKDQVTISFGWAFTKPFTGEMWLLLAGFFISGGIVVYILERSNNRRFRGQPSKQFGSVLWFSFTTWFTNQDDIRTVMGRIVLVAWIFVIGILQSCYTANLSAILTAPRLEPTLNDISSVVASNLRIGYGRSAAADGFVEHYRVSNHRLVRLESDYYDALSRGDVGAIVHERPYMESLVAKHCNRLAYAGQTFTIQNWGFAFDRMNYQLVRDISIRILELSENGELLRLQQHWLPYYDSDCSKYSDQSATRKLQVQHFWGLFVIAGLVSAIVLLFYTVQSKWNKSIMASPTPPPPQGLSGPYPPREGSPGHGGGGFITSDEQGGSLEVMKKIQNMRRTKSLPNAMAFVRI
jgi:ionotropic glutamate receptor